MVEPKIPEYSRLDPDVLERYSRLEDEIRMKALTLVNTEDLEKVEDSAHLLATVLIGVAYGILEDSGYDPRKVMEGFVETAERAGRGDLVFVEPSIPN